MAEIADQKALQVFQEKLTEYKQLIDDDIDVYVKNVEKTTLKLYGAHARLATDAFNSILKRGGKRIRGALTMLGYEMSGGTDKKMILQAARAIEMIHAYILIIDDIQDRSSTRRGGSTAHQILADYHQKHHLADDSHHFGESIAINAALLGNHAAHIILADLDVDPLLRNNIVSIINQTMVVTAHGQTNDILNEVSAEVSRANVDRVLEWKTAYYSFLNPLHVGMVLAGSDSHTLDAITPYAINTGRAYQITDDILGTFGTEFESGKSPLDDLREGKRTILTVYALEHAEKTDKNFLIHTLGKQDLAQTEFIRCKDILVESGALDYAKSQTRTSIQKAIASLKDCPDNWDKNSVLFLKGLAEYLLNRHS